MRHLELCHLPLDVQVRIVQFQPSCVQPEELCKAGEPQVLPAGQRRVTGGAFDEIAPGMHPTPCQCQCTAEDTRQFLVGRESVTHQDRPGSGLAEQLPGSLGAARCIDRKPDRIAGNSHPQPGAAGTAVRKKRLHPPTGFVAMEHPEGSLAVENRLRQRCEQRQETVDAAGQCPRRNGQALTTHPCRDLIHRPMTGVALKQKAGPETDAVRRVCEQPGNRRRRDFLWRGCTGAGPPEPIAPKDPGVGPDRELDHFRVVVE